jgi:CheY-like chemotaxis protein
LKDIPYQIDVAENGEIAVNKFQSATYDLVLMDMQMPVLDGYAAIQAIRQWEREQGLEATPIVALTAHALKEEMDKSLEAGCTAHVTKPIHKAALMEIICEHTRSVSMMQRREEDSGGKITVQVNSAFKNVLPGFLDRRYQDIVTLRQALTQSDYETVRILGHNMRGSGSSFGFDAISDIGASLEKAAKEGDAETIGKWVDALESYLGRVEVVFE